MMRYLAAVAVLISASTLVSPQDVRIVEVPLVVDTVTLQAPRTLVDAAVRSASAASGFVVLSADRELWRLTEGGELVSLRAAPSLPAEANWFSHTCSAADRVMVEVGSYPEERLLKDRDTPRGGFKAGPEPLGVAIVTRDAVEFRADFDVLEVWPGIEPVFGEDSLPRSVRPLPQSCEWTGSELVVGAYGFTAALNLATGSARLLDRDGELEFNRHAILLRGDSLWSALDEGGASGGCVERIVRGEAAKRFCILGLNNADLGVDAFLSVGDILLTGSAAGVVELRPRDGSFVHYQLGTVKTQMEAYGVRCEGGRLLALRDDGLAIISLPERRATLLRFAEDSLNTIYAVARLGSEWVIASESVTVVARLPAFVERAPALRSC